MYKRLLDRRRCIVSVDGFYDVSGRQTAKGAMVFLSTIEGAFRARRIVGYLEKT